MSAKNAQAGFTLLEMVCVLAMVGLLAALALPAIPRGTSSARLAAYATDIAALLKHDRNVALRSHLRVATTLDSERGVVRSGADASAVDIPSDVSFNALLAERCDGRKVGSTIDFFPSGVSCGGVIDISRQGVGFQIRVNWLTGGIEVVPIHTS